MNKTYADHDEIIAELNAPSMGGTYFPEAETMETRKEWNCRKEIENLKFWMSLFALEVLVICIILAFHQ